MDMNAANRECERTVHGAFKGLSVMAMILCGVFATPGHSQETTIAGQVDQITNPRAASAQKMFFFEPKLTLIAPGETLAILNSHGEHTVDSIDGLWPKGVEPVAIASDPQARVTFPIQGYYAFRCRRHGQYGMVMLVVAGQPDNKHELIAQIEELALDKREKAALRALFDQAP